jgi:hypothetical protein
MSTINPKVFSNRLDLVSVRDTVQRLQNLLGNRHILSDPRQENMKEILNLKITHRELFIPFAVSILHEAV